MSKMGSIKKPWNYDKEQLISWQSTSKSKLKENQLVQEIELDYKKLVLPYS